MIGLRWKMFVYGDTEKINVLLTIDDLELVEIIVQGGVFGDKSYQNALNIEKAARQAILSNGDIGIVAPDNDSRERAAQILERLYKQVGKTFQNSRLRFF